MITITRRTVLASSLASAIAVPLAASAVEGARAAVSPLIDRYGQVTTKSWAGKITTDAQLKATVAADRAYYASLPRTPHLDTYGGDATSKKRLGLRRTGWFHVQEVAGRSVLVDPLGNEFFSLGANCLGSTGDTYTMVSGREDLYEWLPAKTDPLAKAYSDWGDQTNYSFYVANQIRKYGSYDHLSYWNRQVDRAKAMGFNTAGGFSDYEAKGTPFPKVVHLDDVPFRDINDTGLYDVFAPQAKAEIGAAMKRQTAAYLNDRYVIGYMFFNELPWQSLRNGISGAQASQSATKGVLVEHLRTWYAGNIAKFNAAWGLKAASFDALKEMSFSATTDAALADSNRFSAVYLDAFYGLFADAIRAADPHHLVIGDRWFGNAVDDQNLMALLATAAGKHLDVITYNYYTWNPSLERLGEIYRLSNRTPIMLTEYHFGETSHGLTFAIRMASSELQKGQLYRNYVEQVAASGMVVGAHWFEYLDQAGTGRWYQGDSGEAGAIGVIDVTDQPYKVMLGQVLAAHINIYALTNGRRTPYAASFTAAQTDREGGQVLQIPKATAAITIDGVLDSSWPAGPTITLDSTGLVDGVAEAGVGGAFRFAWDDTNFYLHGTVTDPTPMLNPNHGFDIWNGDAIELFFGPANVSQGGGIQAADTQIIISAQPQDAAGTAEYYWYNERADQPAMQAVVKPAAGGYTIEAAIPLASLGISAVTPPRSMRFDIGLDDGNGKQRQRQFMWNGTAANSSTRDMWGVAWLVDQVTDTTPGQSGPSHPTFRITQPASRHSWPTVAPGSYLLLSASSMNPGEHLVVTIDGKRLGTLVAGDDGTASVWVRMPSNEHAAKATLAVVRGTTTLWSTSIRVHA